MANLKGKKALFSFLFSSSFFKCEFQSFLFSKEHFPFVLILEQEQTNQPTLIRGPQIPSGIIWLQ